MDVPVERIRAAVRLLSPGEITPNGVRLLSSICDEYDNSPHCPDHNPKQHRDRKPPWCEVCGKF